MNLCKNKIKKLCFAIPTLFVGHVAGKQESFHEVF